MATQNQRLAEWIGDKELMQFIKKLSKETDKKNIVEGGLRGGARIVINQAKANARSKGLNKDVTENLRTATVKKNKRAQFGIKFGWMPKGKSKGFYGWFFEVGTVSPRKARSAQKLMFKGEDGEMIFIDQAKGIAPRPFWRPAIDSKKDDAVKVLTTEIKKSMVRFINRRYKKLDIK